MVPFGAKVKFSADREMGSPIFTFTQNVTMVSYEPTKKKAMILISIMHHDKAVNDENNPKRKPEILDCYNKTKRRVDVMDQKVRKTSVKDKLEGGPLVSGQT